MLIHGFLTRLAIHPSGPGSTNGRGPSILRPRKQLMAIGIPYDKPRATTEAERMALKALEEPRNMQPNTTTQAVVRMRAFKGSCNFGCTLANTLEKGRPPSLYFGFVSYISFAMISKPDFIKGLGN